MPAGNLDRHRPVSALLAANTTSQIGNNLSSLAVPWFVLETTGSAGQTGIVVATETLPIILMGVFGGTFVDRYDWKRLSIVSDLASCLATTAIPLLYLIGWLNLPVLLVLVFLGAMLDQPGRTARLAMFPELVRQTSMSLDRANALYGTTRRLAQIVGPSLAGLLVTAIGPVHILWLNGASFLLSALIVARWLPTGARERLLADHAPRGRYLQELATGFRFLRDRTTLLTLIGVFTTGSLLAEPLYAIILPVYAADVLESASALGLIWAGLGAGSLVGTALYAVIAGRWRRRSIVIGAFVLRAACFAVLLVQPGGVVLALAIFLCAVAFQPVNPLFMTYMQEEVPPGLRGRVIGIWDALSSTALPVGILAFSTLITIIGLSATLIVFVVANALQSLLLPFLSSLRQLDAATETSNSTAR